MITASTRRLNVFKCVVDCGGFGQAADHLGISQPSVSAHIRAIESELDQPLFTRSRGSRSKLSKAGEALYAYTVEMLQRAEETSRRIRLLRNCENGDLSLALHRDVAPMILSTHLANFVARFPKVRTVSRTGTIEDVVQLRRDSLVQMALFIGRGEVSGIDSESLGIVPMQLVVAPEHPLAGRKGITAESIMRHPFCAGLEGSRYMQIVRQALGEVGIIDIQIDMQLQDSASVLEVVRLGGRIAAIAACTAERELARGRLVALDLANQPQGFELRCAYSKPSPLPARNFLKFLRQNQPYEAQ